MDIKKDSTQSDTNFKPDDSFIEFMRGLGFCTLGEAIERKRREREMEQIQSKERQDGSTEDQESKA